MKLLERESQLRELDSGALKSATAGEGRVALIYGESGIGKTFLVEQFSREQRDSARVLWAVCDALFTPHPLGPLHDIAAQTQGELLTLLKDASSRQAVFSACLSEMQRQPTILVFEDVHWADEATLDLIKFLGRRIQHTAALLILTYRDDELGDMHPLRLVLGDLLSSSTLRLPLLPLSQASVTALARDAEQDERAGDLFAVTGGNPFFLSEVLANSGANVPPTVRDAVLARAARLSPAAREVLNAASVVPGRIEKWLLGAILSPPTDAVEECIDHGVLRSDGDSLAFRHELARRALEDSLSSSQRQVLHRRALTALIERGEDRSQLSRLVHHARFGEDGAAVLRYSPQAGKQAAAVGAHLEAAAYYQAALRYSERLQPVEHAQLLEQLAFEYYVTSQIQEAIQARTEAIKIWRQIQRPVQEGDNLRWLSRLYWFLGQQAQAERYAKESIRLLETLPPGSELAMAYSNLALLHVLSNEVEEGLLWGNKAISLADALGDTETLCHALNNVGTGETLAGHYEAGQAMLDKSLQIGLEHGYHEHTARAFCNVAIQAVQHRDHGRAFRCFSDGIAYTTERELESWSLYMLAWRALANLDIGYWAEAAEDAQTVLRNTRVVAIARIPAMVALGLVRARRGDPDVWPILDKARDLAIPTGELQRIGPVAIARAEAAWLGHSLDQCATEARDGFELAITHGNTWLTGELAFWMWRSGCLADPPQGAAKPYTLQILGNWREAAEEWKRIGCPYEQAMALADGDEAAKLAALEILKRLGAQPAVDFVQEKLHAVSAQRLEKEKFGGLTKREREAAALIAQGMNNREIAKAMIISIKTVETYVTRILNKLGFDSRVQIAIWAIEKGLVPPAQPPNG